jgi:phosphoribosylanthranilate isomerase
MTEDRQTPQVKICGLTRVSEAQACVALGASAIGCVFYPPSPRNLTLVQARRICEALPPEVVSVGVFANATYDHIVQTVSFCSLKAVQLHGQEPPGLLLKLRRIELPVFKALFSARQPFLSDAGRYQASAFLVEFGQGRLPGGNAEQWDWREAHNMSRNYPLILAGGLAPENVAAAISSSEPDAVDVSSGVETSPGRKDLGRVKTFIEEVARCRIPRNIRRIFQ